MRINNNMSAVITNKQLLRTENNLTKSMERLSSGLKINHAKDNPAGMAISNKMKAQIDALDRASSNASDGTSVLQIADGALNETSAILQRMRELSVQAANGTNSLEDKQAIQDEIKALKDEVNRISKDTEYNSKSLLDGSLDTRVYTDNANVSRVNVSDYVNPGKYEITIKQPAATKATDNATNVGIESTSTGTIDVSGTISINGYSVDIDKNDTKAEVYEKIRAAAEVGEAEMKTDDGKFTGLQASRYGSSASLVLTFSGKDGVTTTADFAAALGYTADLTTDAKTGTMTYDAAKAGKAGTDVQVELSAGTAIAGTTDTSIFSSTATVATDGNRVTITDRDGFSMSFLAKEGKTGKTVLDVTDIGNMTLHIGANEHQNMDVRIQEISCETLYIDDLDVTSVTGADRAISALDDAIAMVSDARSKIGAYENRLEYATSSLDTFEENMTDAMSRLTDVDMAEEMTNYTQYNVLQQAGVSVLSQANDLPQNVLSLLQ
jgi:flagellin